MSKVYVGTYGKYASGSIEGKWFDIEDYVDKEAFIEACQEFHGEGEHEFMFQDWEDIPDSLITESSISEEVWEWMELSEEDKKLLEAYQSRMGLGYPVTIDQARDDFLGVYESEADYAAECFEESGQLEGLPSLITYNIDWDKVARDMQLSSVEVSYKEIYIFNN